MLNPEKPPELSVSRWFNTNEPLTLAGLKGKVVLMSTFQMLCPGCVEYGLPLAQKLYERFNNKEVVALGLHTVFEHHQAMGPDALDAFIKQYGWKFPIGIDAAGDPAGADDSAMPQTMRAYQMQGTPTLLLFDRQGRLRRHYFGKPDELMLGAEIMALAIEPPDASREASLGIEKLLAATIVTPDNARPEPDHGKDAAGGPEGARGHSHGPDCKDHGCKNDGHNGH